MIIYDNCGLYINSKTAAADKIIAIDLVISTLLAAASTSAGNSDISEYSLNDGQVVIRTVYRSTDAIMSAIQSFEKLKQYYINQINPRVFRLIDETNLITGRRNIR